MSWEKKKRSGGGRNRERRQTERVGGRQREGGREGEREGGREKGGCPLASLHSAPINPEVGSLHGKLPCDQERRSGRVESDSTCPEQNWTTAAAAAEEEEEEEEGVWLGRTADCGSTTLGDHGETKRSRCGMHHSHLWMESPAPAAAQPPVPLRVRQRDGRGERVPSAAGERSLRHPPVQPHEVL